MGTYANDCPSGPAALFARPHDIALTHSGNGLRAKVAAVHRLAGRVSLDVTIEGQSRPLLVDVPGHGVARPPVRGDFVELELRHYRIFAKAHAP